MLSQMILWTPTVAIAAAFVFSAILVRLYLSGETIAKPERSRARSAIAVRPIRLANRVPEHAVATWARRRSGV